MKTPVCTILVLAGTMRKPEDLLSGCKIMKYWIFIVILFVAPYVISAMGVVVPPEDYIDIEVFENRSARNRYFGIYLYLPYNKPAGLSAIYSTDIASIKIDQLLVDDQLIKPKLNWASAIEAKYEVWNEEIGDSAQPMKLKMIWSFNRGKRFVYYTSWMHFESDNPYDYQIPEGSKEVYMTYRIVFPNGEETEPQTVHWTMSWEDLNRS